METFDRKEAEDYGLIPAIVLQGIRDKRDLSYLRKHDVDRAINYLEIRKALIDGKPTKAKYTKNSNDVWSIYNAYPTKCPISLRHTGKTSKNRDKVVSLLNSEYSVDDLMGVIKRYVMECESSNVYMKNFSTFLNNIPDYSQGDVKIKKDQVDIDFLDRYGKQKLHY